MAEETGKKTEEAAEAPKSSKMMLIIIIVAALVVAGGGAYFFLGGSSGEKTEESAEPAKEAGAKGEKHKNAKEGENGGNEQVLALEPFIVNLQDNNGTRYLKVTINIEMDAPGLEEAKAKSAQIKDSIIILLSSKGYADVGTIEGKYQLRDEILERVNESLSKGKANALYFSEFVIQ